MEILFNHIPSDCYTSHISILFIDIWYIIFSYLNLQNIANILIISSNFYETFNTDSFLTYLSKRFFPKLFSKKLNEDPRNFIEKFSSSYISNLHVATYYNSMDLYGLLFYPEVQFNTETIVGEDFEGPLNEQDMLNIIERVNLYLESESILSEYVVFRQILNDRMCLEIDDGTYEFPLSLSSRTLEFLIDGKYENAITALGRTDGTYGNGWDYDYMYSYDINIDILKLALQHLGACNLTIDDIYKCFVESVQEECFDIHPVILGEFTQFYWRDTLDRALRCDDMFDNTLLWKIYAECKLLDNSTDYKLKDEIKNLYSRRQMNYEEIKLILVNNVNLFTVICPKIRSRK